MVTKIPDIPILLSAFTFLTIFLISVGIIQYVRQQAKKAELKEKIRQTEENWENFGEENSSLESPDKSKWAALNFFAVFGKRVLPNKTSDLPRIRARFLKAGLRKANVPAVFWGTKCFLAICLPMCFFPFRITVFKVMNAPVTVAIIIYLALLGFYLPDVWLRIKTVMRKKNIFEGIPDALDLLVVCVEAGMGLDAAINRVGEEIKLTNKVLSDELKFLNLELRAGKSRQAALRNLAMRTDLEDVNSLVTLLIQTDKFGTSVAKALRVYSDTFRTKRYQKAEELAAKLPVKLVVPLILFIFPSLFVTILGPAAIRVYEVFILR
jgi:tight adherence protein C